MGLHKYSYQISKPLLLYLPGIPLEWTSDYRQLSLSNSKWKIVLYIICILDMIAFIAAGNVYVLITRVYLKNGNPVGLDLLLCIVFGTSSIVLLVIVMLILYLNRHEALAGANHFFVLAEELTRLYRPAEVNAEGEYQNPTGTDVVGTTACVISFTISAVPVWLTIVLVFNNYDPLDVAIDDIFSDPKYWSYNTILLAGGIRYICCLISMIVGSHHIVYLAMLCLALLTNSLQCMKILLDGIEMDEDFFKYYTRFFVAFKYMRSILDNILLVLLTSFFWGSSIGIWACITVYDEMDSLLHSVVVFGTVVDLFTLIYSFSKGKAWLEMSIAIVENRRASTTTKFTVLKTRKAKLNAKRGKAITSAPLMYGPFHPISTEYLMEYFYSMIQQVVDFLVLSQ
ncbi:unnamed protein product [Orchesella dallaii]|uniref:Gustatory receptor n=1 Tax=Orchesella dallaii TaxID=48710 RepID=A0ABP1PSX6_9HEXA